MSASSSAHSRTGTCAEHRRWQQPRSNVAAAGAFASYPAVSASSRFLPSSVSFARPRELTLLRRDSIVNRVSRSSSAGLGPHPTGDTNIKLLKVEAPKAYDTPPLPAAIGKMIRSAIA
jgi:hypothetical protein